MSFCYLIHFDSPPRVNQQHCIGYTSDLPQCKADHLAGRGSELTKAAVKQGISMTFAKFWTEGSRELEIILRQRGNYKRLCPICRNNGKSKENIL